MGQVTIFAQLGAPLEKHNSWGAVRQADGVVFLTLWEDRIRTIDGVRYGRITHHGKFAKKRVPNPEYPKRLEHVDRIRKGHPCYLVINKARDTEAITRSVGSVIQDEVFVGGKLIEHDGETWIEVGKGVPIEHASAPLT